MDIAIWQHKQKVMKRNKKQRNGHRDVPISTNSNKTETKSNEMETRRSETETKSDETEQKVANRNKKYRNGHCYMAT